MSRHRRALAAVALWALAAAGLAAVPLGAQTSEIEAAKAEREAARAAAAEAAGRLDPLLAEDAELEVAVADLTAHVALQQARLDAIRQSLRASRVEAREAAARVDDMAGRIDGLRASLVRRAVEAYVEPDGQRVDPLLTTADVTVAAHKQALLDAISSNEADLIDQLRGAEDQLVELRRDAEDAVVRVRAEEAAEAEQLVALENALAEQRRLQRALDRRIADVQAEVDALAAEENDLTVLITSLITEEEQRQAALALAQQQAEAAAAAAAAQPDDSASPPDVPTPAPLPPPSTAGGMVWPAGGVVTSGFGPRWGRAHQGIDIAAPTGTAIVAAQSGTVVSAGPYGGYGNMVLIDHGGGFTTVYAHLSAFSVGAGQAVGAGQLLGQMGCTGSCTGPHLHFETRVNGVAQDPMLYLG